VTAEEKATSVFISWYKTLANYSGFPAKGTIAGSLVVLERLKDNFDLDIDAHTAKGGSQIRGAGGSAVRHILESFGETRPFLSEGGRTNRGLRGGINGMLDAIGSTRLDRLASERRNAILSALQLFLVDRVRDFHSLQRLEIVYDPAKSTWQSIQDLLSKAAEAGKDGPVAQYLVGAKLQLRFPETEISNESYSTADVQTRRRGDFQIGDTVFHVTVAPMLPLFEKCRRNIDEGFKVYLLVPDRVVAGTKQNSELQAAGKISVESIESFVSQNIDELSAFSKSEVKKEFRELLEIYNKRVDAVETNKSMMIEIPVNLAPAST
jgi:hypothetical protein